MASGANCYQIRNKTCYMPKFSNFNVEKRYFLVTCLKASTVICVIYRPEHNAKGERSGGHLSSYHLNVIRLIFYNFCWWQRKVSHNFGKMFRCIWKISFSFFRKYYRLLDFELPLARCQLLKIRGFGIFFLIQQGFFIFVPFVPWISQKPSLQSLLTIPFPEKIQEDL